MMPAPAQQVSEFEMHAQDESVFAKTTRTELTQKGYKYLLNLLPISINPISVKVEY